MKTEIIASRILISKSFTKASSLFDINKVSNKLREFIDNFANGFFATKTNTEDIKPLKKNIKFMNISYLFLLLRFFTLNQIKYPNEKIINAKIAIKSAIAPKPKPGPMYIN